MNPTTATPWPTLVPSVPEPMSPDKTNESVGSPKLSEVETDSERAAMREYTTLRVRDTLMSLLYRAHAEDMRRRFDPMLKYPNWPERLADQCAREVHAYLQPGFLSPTGEFSVLPDESFDNYHVRREVMKKFNAMVFDSDERNVERHPAAIDPDAPLSRKISDKAAFLRQHQPDFFENPDWPERLTKLCLEQGD